MRARANAGWPVRFSALGIVGNRNATQAVTGARIPSGVSAVVRAGLTPSHRRLLEEGRSGAKWGEERTEGTRGVGAGQRPRRKWTGFAPDFLLPALVGPVSGLLRIGIWRCKSCVTLRAAPRTGWVALTGRN